MATVIWLLGASGDWANPMDWSSFLFSPGINDDAVIAASGTYTVAVSEAEAAHSLALSAANATLDISNDLSIGTIFSATAGTLKLETGGTIQGGTLIPNGVNQVWAGGTLSGLTYQGTVDLSAAGASVVLGNKLHFLGAGGTAGTIDLTGTGASVSALAGDLDNLVINIANGDTFALTGPAGTLTVDVHTNLAVSSGQAGTLTGVAAAGDAILNSGTINAAGNLTIDALKFTNAGQVQVPGTLIANNFTNTGTITLEGGTISLGSGPIESSGTIEGQGTIVDSINDSGRVIANGDGTLEIAGLVETGEHVTIASNAVLRLDAGITAGRVIGFQSGGTNSALFMADPFHFFGTVDNFDISDRIQLSALALSGTSTATGDNVAAEIVGNAIDIFGTFAGGTLVIPTSNALNSSALVAVLIPNGGFYELELFHLAQPDPHTPDPVTLGNHHVGDTVSQAITISNTVRNDGFSENLDATIGGASTGITAIGGFTGLTAQATDNTHLTVGLNTTTSGVKSGTATLNLSSDGTGVDNRSSALASQTVNVTGTVYAYASPTVAAVLNLGAIRVGSINVNGFFTVSNGAKQDQFQEPLIANFPIGYPNQFAIQPLTAPPPILSGGTGSFGLTLSSATAGDFRNTKMTMGLTSQAIAGSGFGNTTLTPQTIILNGEVFAPAIETFSTNSLNFGVVHIGDTVSQAVTVTNSATGALTDNLTGAVVTIAGMGGFSIPVPGSISLTGGASTTVAIDISTMAAGPESGTFVPVWFSSDSILPNIALSGGIGLTGTVDNYATAAVSYLGSGQFSQNGTAYTLDLGQIHLGSTLSSNMLTITNAATGVADQMSTSFSVSGSGEFINSGLAGTILAAANSVQSQITLGATQVGTISETITIHAVGTNSGGFSGALADQIVTVTGTVTPPPRQMTWIAGTGTDFSTATNWYDATDNSFPATAAPNVTDTAVFNGGGTGQITGTGTVDQLVFAGDEAWHTGSGVALTAITAMTVDQSSVLLIHGGAAITSEGSASIAAQGGAGDSEIDVSGVGSQLNVAGQLNVGVAGSGGLQLSGGATVTAGSLDAANVATAVANISVSGAATDLAITGAAVVGDDGTGVLSVLSGATFSAASLTIGSQGDSSGALVVSGDGSLVNLTGALNIGTALGIGDLTVGPGAAVNAGVVNLQGQVVIEGGLLDPTVQLINQGQTAGGFGTIAAGDIVDEGVIQAGGNKAAQKLLLVQGIVLGGGTLTVNGTQPGSNSAGVLQINAGGTLELTGAVVNAATTTFTDNLTPTGTYTVNNSVVDVTFADAAGVLKLDDIAGFAGTIATNLAGDSFVITGGTLSGLSVSSGNTLSFADSGSGAGVGGIDSIIFAAPVSSAGFNIVNGNTVQVACFAAGTLIETATGLVAVEDLRVGDSVVLASEDGHEPIVWIGQRTVNCARHPEPETVWPVRVAAGAFGENVPVRDLYLSPDHAVFVNGVLVPVKLLIDHASIAQVRVARVRYFHVELPRHGVILAEGLPVESYLDTGDRASFNRDGATIRLFPDFAARLGEETAVVWETRGAAPLVMTGQRLAAARQEVMAPP